MLVSGTTIENPVRGERATLTIAPAETGGAYFELDYQMAPGWLEPTVPPHLHPQAEERFTLVAGRARYRVGRDEGELGAGESVVMPAGVPHVHPWNVGDGPLHFVQRTSVNPADQAGLERSLAALATIYGLARDGKVDRQGNPAFLQLALIASTTLPATFLEKPPAPVQRVLFPLLGALARRLGFRAAYAGYPRFAP